MSRWMSRELPVKIVCLSALAAFVFAQSASAQITPTPARPVVTEAAKPDPAKDAFLALPAADRKAAQEALVWLGHYNGVTDGAFGKRTLEAIQAYQKKTGARPDGVLTSAALADLKAAADKPRAALGFAPFDDSGTGMRISAPLKSLEKRTIEPGHTRLASKDGSVTLNLYAPTKEETLDALYRSRIADAPDRKVSYKAIKPNVFFVVSGEDGETKFYSRYAEGEKGVLRGFEFRYPKARAEALDRVALAIANAFEPFPINTLGTAPKPASTPVAIVPVATTPTLAPTPSGPVLIATAFVIEPGQALTALAPAQCAKPFVAGAAATFGRVDEVSGLARLDGDFGAGAAPASFGDDVADAILLSRAPSAQPDKSVLEASRGDWVSVDGHASLMVSATATARGAPVLNGRGELVGILGASKTKPHRIGGVILAEPRDAIAGAALKAFLADGQSVSGETLTAPELARKLGARTLGVTCAS
jgi:hypothetical protein